MIMGVNNEGFMDMNKLRELFPELEEEIDDLTSLGWACGCSLCIFRALKAKHPELVIPDEYMYGVWV